VEVVVILALQSQEIQVLLLPLRERAVYQVVREGSRVFGCHDCSESSWEEGSLQGCHKPVRIQKF
jgi:hypothetical protein